MQTPDIHSLPYIKKEPKSPLFLGKFWNGFLMLFKAKNTNVKDKNMASKDTTKTPTLEGENWDIKVSDLGYKNYLKNGGKLSRKNLEKKIAKDCQKLFVKTS